MALTKEQTNRSIEQNRWEIDPYNVTNWSMAKEQWQFNRERLVFSADSADTHVWKNWDINLTYLTKINAKWISNLKIKVKTMKLLNGNNIGENVSDPELGKLLRYNN